MRGFVFYIFLAFEYMENAEGIRMRKANEIQSSLLLLKTASHFFAFIWNFS